MKQTIIYQRLEAVLVFVTSLYFFVYLDFNLIVFAVLLFSFDIFMLGYLFGSKVGAHTYNIGHSMIGPALSLIAGIATDNRIVICFSLIWFAHIGIDRALGYGLKFTTGFKDTHLGHIGKEK